MAPSSDEGGAEKSPPIDWGEIFTDLVGHTSITRTEIPNMTIPEIQAYRKNLGRIVSMKMGIGDILNGPSLPPPTTQEESSQEDVESFFGGF